MDGGKKRETIKKKKKKEEMRKKKWGSNVLNNECGTNMVYYNKVL
jgi:hypothetical protein